MTQAEFDKSMIAMREVYESIRDSIETERQNLSANFHKECQELTLSLEVNKRVYEKHRKAFILENQPRWGGANLNSKMRNLLFKLHRHISHELEAFLTDKELLTYQDSIVHFDETDNQVVFTITINKVKP